MGKILNYFVNNTLQNSETSLLKRYYFYVHKTKHKFDFTVLKKTIFFDSLLYIYNSSTLYECEIIYNSHLFCLVKREHNIMSSNKETVLGKKENKSETSLVKSRSSSLHWIIFKSNCLFSYNKPMETTEAAVGQEKEHSCRA